MSYWIKQGAVFLSFIVLLTAAMSVTKICNENAVFAAVGMGGGRKTVIIDAGHGSPDGGAVSVTGVLEKDINLDIALKLEQLFRLYGYDVIMTRSADNGIHDKGVKGIGNQKRSDIKNRMKIINDNPHAVFISIHQNQFTSSKYRGAQVFYAPSNTDSGVLADVIQKVIADELQPYNERLTKKATDDLYLLYNARIPAVMVECGFISNYEDAALLTDPDYQLKLALCIVRGYMLYENS